LEAGDSLKHGDTPPARSISARPAPVLAHDLHARLAGTLGASIATFRRIKGSVAPQATALNTVSEYFDAAGFFR
jgi:hypothetical protein